MTIARQHLVRRIDQATGQAGPFLQLGFPELPVILRLTITGMGLEHVDQFAVLAA